MKKELPDKKDTVLVHYYKSIRYSIQGLKDSFKGERSFKLYSFCAILLLILSFYVNISFKDALVVIFMMTMILMVELLNTAIENVVDLVTKEKNDYAKRAKDCGSAATFVVVVLGILMGFIIFIPYFN